MGIDDLLAVPPREFTAARNALVAELRRAGKSAEAATAQKLRKPTRPVWVVNQVARRHGADVKAFVAAADDLRRASLGGRANLQEATARHQAGLRALLRRAEQVLEGAGYRQSADAMLRVSNTLLGAAADPAARSELLRGRLTEERRPPGLEALLEASERKPGKVVSLEAPRAAGATAADRSSPRAKAASGSAARAAAADRAAARAARAAARARKRAETQARARLRTAEQTERRRRKRAEQAERAAAALRARLQVAERDAAEARAAQQRAAEEARRAGESLRD